MPCQIKRWRSWVTLLLLQGLQKARMLNQILKLHSCYEYVLVQSMTPNSKLKYYFKKGEYMWMLSFCHFFPPGFWLFLSGICILLPCKGYFTAGKTGWVHFRSVALAEVGFDFCWLASSRPFAKSRPQAPAANHLPCSAALGHPAPVTL